MPEVAMFMIELRDIRRLLTPATARRPASLADGRADLARRNEQVF